MGNNLVKECWREGFRVFWPFDCSHVFEFWISCTKCMGNGRETILLKSVGEKILASWNLLDTK